jgi:hypothetical protein
MVVFNRRAICACDGACNNGVFTFDERVVSARESHAYAFRVRVVVWLVLMYWLVNTLPRLAKACQLLNFFMFCRQQVLSCCGFGHIYLLSKVHAMFHRPHPQQTGTNRILFRLVET